MGSWNETCLLTNLPIMENDEVVLFLLEETINTKKHVYCNAHDEWAPRGIHLYGTYRDYGNYDIHTTKMSKLTLHALTDQLHETEVDEDIAVKKDGFDWDTVNEAIHASRLFVRRWTGNVPNPPGVTRVAVLRKVWDELLKINYNSIYDGSTLMSAEKIPESVYEYIEAVQKQIKSFSNIIPKDGSDDEKLTAGLIIQMRMQSEGPELKSTNIFKPLYGTSGLSFHISWSVATIIQLVVQLIQKDAIKQAEEVLTEVAKFNFFCSWFDMTRHRWAPTAGAGSQCQDYEEYIKLARITQKFCEDRIKESDED